MHKTLKYFLFSIVHLIYFNMYSQNQVQYSSNTYPLPTSHDTINISKKGYYISEIVDARPLKSNLGYLIIDTTKNTLVFPDSLPSYLKSFLQPHKIDSGGFLSPLEVHIERFRIFATTAKQTNIGQIYLKATFNERTKNGIKEIHSIDHTFDYKKPANEAFLSNLILTALKTSLMGIRNKKAVVQNNMNSLPTAGNNYSEKVTNTSTKRILKAPSVSWQNTGYFIRRVIDSRTSKEREIEALEGLLNRRKDLYVDSTLPYYLHSMLVQDSGSTKIPLQLVIKKFYGKETQTAEGERGRLFFYAQLQSENTNAGTSTIFEQQIVKDSTSEFDITHAWPTLISNITKHFLATFDTSTSSNSLLHSTDTSRVSDLPEKDEIQIDKYSLKTKYFWHDKQLKKSKEFKPAFQTSSSHDVKTLYKQSRNAHVTGNVLLITGATLLAYSATDFLVTETPEYKKWSSSNWRINSHLDFLTKKTAVNGGIVCLATGILLNLVGKSLLQEAIDKYNSSITKKVRLSFLPDIMNKNLYLSVNITLGY